jgi:hypothetical protein
MIDVVFLIPVVRELVDAPGFAVIVPSWTPIAVPEDAAAALIAAGYAVAATDFTPPPPDPSPLDPPDFHA